MRNSSTTCRSLEVTTEGIRPLFLSKEDTVNHHWIAPLVFHLRRWLFERQVNSKINSPWRTRAFTIRMTDLWPAFLWRVPIQYLESFLEPYYLDMWIATFDLNDRLNPSLRLEMPPPEYYEGWTKEHGYLIETIIRQLRAGRITVPFNELQPIVSRKLELFLHDLAGVLKMSDILFYVKQVEGEKHLVFMPLSAG